MNLLNGWGNVQDVRAWNTMVEETIRPEKSVRGLSSGNSAIKQKPQSIVEVKSEQEPRIPTNYQEFNRVLGGGIVPGSLVLVGGDPGIGKSTLLLQTSAQLAQKGERVLYISGEESVKQTKLRADRLDIAAKDLYVLAETDMELIEQAMDDIRPICHDH